MDPRIARRVVGRSAAQCGACSRAGSVAVVAFKDEGLLGQSVAFDWVGVNSATPYAEHVLVNIDLGGGQFRLDVAV